MWTVLVAVLVIAGQLDKSCAVFDFEDVAELSSFRGKGGSSVTISNERYKHGNHSLKWTWRSRSSLRVRLRSQNIVGTDVAKGGLKFWIYNEVPKPHTCLEVRVIKLSTPTTTQNCAGLLKGSHRSHFYISLDFNGWRAVWIAYNEFKNIPTSPPRLPRAQRHCCTDQIIYMKFHAPAIQHSQHSLYLDLLRWVKKMKGQSRDSVVPIPLKHLSCNNLVSGVTEANALHVFKRKKFWHQTYRWSLVNVPPIPTLSTQTLSQKLPDLKLIEKRLVNWFADERKTFIRLPGMTSYPHGVVDVVNGFFLRRRWDDLMTDVDRAYRKFWNLNITKSSSTPPVITGSPLFCRDSEYGNPTFNQRGAERKFGYVMHKVLLPLAMEYHLKSRPLEVNNTACQLATKYPPGVSNFSDVDTNKVTGTDSDMKDFFLREYRNYAGSQTTPHCSGAHNYEKFVHAIQKLNEKRKENLLLLFEYIRDQGWTNGSAVGSTNHEMNKNGAGFAHSVFLLRKELKAAGMLDSHIDTLKYYTDFNEIYQRDYEYDGTTADRMRTILLFRLMAVLMMPQEPLRPKALAKVRDMENWKRWFNNAVRINKGLGGVIKPDYTSFHHHTFYGAAYCPHAIHVGALVYYLTEGTSFASSPYPTRKNLKETLNVFKVVSVKYSTPNSIGGRTAKYSSGILAKTAPAFAYLAVSAPKWKTGSTDQLGDITRVKNRDTRTFLRLFDVGTVRDCTTTNGNILPMILYLCHGKFSSSIHYLNSLGSLQIMQTIKDIADRRGLIGESSPRGHWAKNFGALSIHRRDDWAVTMKGFNNFVWDTESSPNENVFGLYQSHGALQISNSEDTLRSYGVEEGWDWSAVPGTTTIHFNITDLKTTNNGIFNPKRLAGGVTFSGKNPYNPDTLNGAFGMDFSQPAYGLPTGSPIKHVEFKFKKSVVFYEDFLVCTGSSITTRGVRNSAETRTTLFQDRIPSPSVTPTTTPPPGVYRCGSGIAKDPSSWGTVASVVLEDTNGNRYFVPRPAAQKLHFKPKEIQHSLLENGGPSTTTGTYCIAWFSHEVNKANKKYEYTVKIYNGASTALDLQASDYEIVQVDSTAHAVKVNRNMRPGAGPLFSYTIFGTIADFSSGSGPIRSVHGSSCLVMAQVDNGLSISVSCPDLNLEKASTAPRWCPSGSPSRPVKGSNIGILYKFCAESAAQRVEVNIKDTSLSRVEHIYVNGKIKRCADMNNNSYIKMTGDLVEFKNLKNGFTTEVRLIT